VKLLLDEMFTGLRDHFILLGWEAYTVDDVGLKGAGDMEVARYAKENGLILVTEDKRKPVDFMKLLGGRYVLVDTSMLVNMIIRAVEEKYG
jgi:predicted nuclease of predicted toxin-antitoxin system